MVTIIIGAQWGDEGKGKIGGNNAGHTFDMKNKIIRALGGSRIRYIDVSDQYDMRGEIEDLVETIKI